MANASNPKDIQVGLTAEQVQFTKTFVVDALLVGTGMGDEGATIAMRIQPNERKQRLPLVFLASLQKQKKRWKKKKVERTQWIFHNVRLCFLVVLPSSCPYRQGSIAALGRDHTSAWHYTRQRTIATAASYFWRFYLKHSFCDHEPTAIAVVCVSLAAKVEENPVHKHEKLTKDLTRALRRCVYGEEAELEEDRLLALELVVMEELGFNLSVFDPYTPLRKFLKNAGDADADVLSTAWGLLNDSLVSE